MEKEVLSNPILWSPSEERIKSSQMYKFMLYINEKYNFKLGNFSELHNWSIENKKVIFGHLFGISSKLKVLKE